MGGQGTGTPSSYPNIGANTGVPSRGRGGHGGADPALASCPPAALAAAMAVAKATAGVGGNPTEQAAAALAAAMAAGASPDEAAAAAAAAVAASCGLSAADAAAAVAAAGPGGSAKIDPKAALRTPRTGRPDARGSGKGGNRGRSSSPTQKYSPHSPYYNSGDESKVHTSRAV